MARQPLFGCDFEVFGKVQRVFFRKYTACKAKKLGIRGWCQNTTYGTVKGRLEGTRQELVDMKYWLKFKGSPKSKIEKTEFSEYIPIKEYSLSTFEIRQ